MTHLSNPAVGAHRVGHLQGETDHRRPFAVGDRVRVRVDSRVAVGRVGVIERANPYGEADPLGVWYVRFAATGRAAERLVCLGGWQLAHDTGARDDA